MFVVGPHVPGALRARAPGRPGNGVQDVGDDPAERRGPVGQGRRPSGGGGAGRCHGLFRAVPGRFSGRRQRLHPPAEFRARRRAAAVFGRRSRRLGGRRQCHRRAVGRTDGRGRGGFGPGDGRRQRQEGAQRQDRGHVKKHRRRRRADERASRNRRRQCGHRRSRPRGVGGGTGFTAEPNRPGGFPYVSSHFAETTHCPGGCVRLLANPRAHAYVDTSPDRTGLRVLPHCATPTLAATGRQFRASYLLRARAHGHAYSVIQTRNPTVERIYRNADTVAAEQVFK